MNNRIRIRIDGMGGIEVENFAIENNPLGASKAMSCMSILSVSFSLQKIDHFTSKFMEIMRKIQARKVCREILSSMN